ncbi:hypothetical protein K438DRAFT_1585309, partial [Mycena galopus ATCC 62051]
QDRPLQNWYPMNDEYIQENLRREGRGAPKTYARCAGSHCMDRRECPGRECDGASEWHCVDQACLGELMFCQQCIVATHARHPTHFVEKWDGTHFVRNRRWLQILGLRLQLGHLPGVICPFREAAAHDFVLYDTTGVHELSVDFCGCMDTEGALTERRIQLLHACWWPAMITAPNTCATFRVLRLFHKLNCMGNVSAYDFLRGLEMTTNHNGLDKPPDRRKPFMHIMRQWREVKRQKRARWGHCAGGARATKQGELALPCRACPQPGWNLLEGWDRADTIYKRVKRFHLFLYCLFLAQDANFRLSNRVVSSEAADPIMGNGMGYFCKHYSEDGYNAHIEKHAGEEEMSNCSSFNAMHQANLKRTKGLRTTGIGGVTCSRHNMWRANGIGDLQVGERYCNMDFLLLTCLISFRLLLLILSYDIACQYAINFWQRMTGLPESMRLSIPLANAWWKVPNFHLPDHRPGCHSPYSFHWTPGVGLLHREGMEQNWAFSNGAAASTRLMGPGSRQATLQDIFGFHNYDRLLAMHRVLPKHLAVAIQDGEAHKVLLKVFTKGLEQERPEEVQKWRESVEKWYSIQHTTAEDSPFEFQEEVTTLRDIQSQIAAEELICTGQGLEIEQEHTPGARRLAVDVRAVKDASPTQKLGFTKRRTALLKRIYRFCQIQRVYMPSLRGILSDAQKEVFDVNGDEVPEATRLFMPSEIPDGRRREEVCALGLPEIEARMREGEATEALEAVCTGLRTRTMTNRYKLRNYTGQGMMMKGQGILRAINIHIHITKVRYRYSRAALLVLRGHRDWEQWLRMLLDDDGGIACTAGVARGEGSRTMSWIWYVVGKAEEEDDPRLADALRVEWCKAQARSDRYDEEVRLLREEMRRTIAYGQAMARLWDDLALAELPGASAELTEGRCAYAAEHASVERARCADLENRWRGILQRAGAYLDGGDTATRQQVTVEVGLEDELDPEQEEVRLEGEEEDPRFPSA